MPQAHSKSTLQSLVGPTALLGLRLVEDPTMVEYVEHRVERKWAHRKMWRPEQRFTVVSKHTKPSRTIYQVHDTLVMHPAMAEEIRTQLKTMQTIPQLPNVSMGYSVKTDTPERRKFWESAMDIPIRSNRDIVRGLI